ncbi:hypothetical protein HAX54_013937, partial [Datura stramonium]|nr:hypothetical protein [Datura stramonium]
MTRIVIACRIDRLELEGSIWTSEYYYRGARFRGEHWDEHIIIYLCNGRTIAAVKLPLQRKCPKLMSKPIFPGRPMMPTTILLCTDPIPVRIFGVQSPSQAILHVLTCRALVLKLR